MELRKQRPPIAVSDAGGVRSLHIGGVAVQSAMRIDAPDALHLDYTRCMLACLLFGAGSAVAPRLANVCLRRVPPANSSIPARAQRDICRTRKYFISQMYDCQVF